MEQEYGHEAQEVLLELIVGDMELKIDVYKIDRHNRCIADVYCNDVLVQEMVLSLGAAWYAPHFGENAVFEERHRIAKASRVGL
ncbi:putative staphylococcal nuclease (SNase-like), SNase-like, superfamily [Helianthus annuus]|uniref:Staphylococcal nuclease (SNase-like), SNase-like, superfamily n=1 Tax=Helianthus annuus TaxID=4232 RepID=A0A9K3EJK8_HELAN|nr:putative staphylococcal nuclease (SNase-like), SNase-like, superfamily [Helianthus annuus]KAJ0850525.1 putative staphylococcal nuclease (SNase-like), SNase-like, superfamily [Helianthus annuus]KAJ0859590.1 putative staphylococcal nuclease (SNase-like), SNase-like, superfamily [Helianthus annuus]